MSYKGIVNLKLETGSVKSIIHIPDKFRSDLKRKLYVKKHLEHLVPNQYIDIDLKKIKLIGDN